MREALDTAEFPSLLGLLDQDAAQVWPSRQDRQYLRPGQIRYYWEDGMEAGMKASFDSWRHDQPLSRSRWQFAPRREWVALSGGEQG